MSIHSTLSSNEIIEGTKEYIKKQNALLQVFKKWNSILNKGCKVKANELLGFGLTLEYIIEKYRINFLIGNVEAKTLSIFLKESSYYFSISKISYIIKNISGSIDPVEYLNGYKTKNEEIKMYISLIEEGNNKINIFENNKGVL